METRRRHVSCILHSLEAQEVRGVRTSPGASNLACRMSSGVREETPSAMSIEHAYFIVPLIFVLLAGCISKL